MIQANRPPLLGLLRKALLKIPGAPFDVNYLCVLEHEGVPSVRTLTSESGIQVREATPNDTGALAECQGSAPNFARRFKAGDHCVAAVCGEQIIGYEWFCEKSCYVEERYLYPVLIPASTLYAYDAFVREGYRRRDVWKRFQSEYVGDLMRWLGKTRIRAMVDEDNRVSMNAHLRHGYRPKERVFIAKAFGKSVCLTKPFLTPQRITVEGTALARSAHGQVK